MMKRIREAANDNELACAMDHLGFCRGDAPKTYTEIKIVAPLDTLMSRTSWLRAHDNDIPVVDWSTCVMGMVHACTHLFGLEVYGGALRDLIVGGFVHKGMDIDVHINGSHGHGWIRRKLTEWCVHNHCKYIWQVHTHTRTYML